MLSNPAWHQSWPARSYLPTLLPYYRVPRDSRFLESPAGQLGNFFFFFFLVGRLSEFLPWSHSFPGEPANCQSTLRGYQLPAPLHLHPTLRAPLGSPRGNTSERPAPASMSFHPATSSHLRRT